MIQDFMKFNVQSNINSNTAAILPFSTHHVTRPQTENAKFLPITPSVADSTGADRLGKTLSAGNSGAAGPSDAIAQYPSLAASQPGNVNLAQQYINSQASLGENGSRVNTILQTAKEFKIGAKTLNATEYTNTTLGNGPGDTFRKIAAVYKNNGNEFDNNKLKELLQKSGNADLIDDGVGQDETKTISAVSKALDRGTLQLNQIYNKTGNDSGAVKNREAFENAANYVVSGSFDKDVKNLESGNYSAISPGVANNTPAPGAQPAMENKEAAPQQEAQGAPQGAPQQAPPAGGGGQPPKAEQAAPAGGAGEAAKAAPVSDAGSVEDTDEADEAKVAAANAQDREGVETENQGDTDMVAEQNTADEASVEEQNAADEASVEAQNAADDAELAQLPIPADPSSPEGKEALQVRSQKVQEINQRKSKRLQELSQRKAKRAEELAQRTSKRNQDLEARKQKRLQQLEQRIADRNQQLAQRKAERSKRKGNEEGEKTGISSATVTGPSTTTSASETPKPSVAQAQAQTKGGKPLEPIRVTLS